VLLLNNCLWVINCEKAFLNSQGGDKDAMQKCYEQQVDDLSGLIMMVTGPTVDKPLRTKLMCMITMDAHSRDMIRDMRDGGCRDKDHFLWKVQLKGMYSAEKDDFQFRIADACLPYGYEYLGNGPRLVITPLTDRIHVTATQALHLMMGCAPAGPAGTGKTESTKDLAAALGKPCYVFNCSDQMD
jgi:dynein heavy chain